MSTVSGAAGHETVIGVFPRAEKERRARLFEGLSQAFPVTFEGREAGDVAGLDGCLFLGSPDGPAPATIPSLTYLNARPAGTSRSPGRVELEQSAIVEQPLRGRALDDREALGAERVPVDPGDEVLASADGRPLWLARAHNGGRSYVADLAPDELGDEESLRDLLVEGRFMSFLPLVHFLREACGQNGWQRPPLRACFIIDDPNLHWPSYGGIRYRELAQDARERGYHVTMAMVPLDGWFAHPTASRIFRDSSRELSLAVHGNDHVKWELDRPRRDGYLPLGARALRRISAFERRSGVQVARVMVPPHDRCAQEALLPFARVGFDAIMLPFGHRSSSDLLASWEAAEFRESLSVVKRRNFRADMAEWTLMAYLGQPLIAYGHERNLRKGFDVLANLSSAFNSFGSVDWMSLGDIVHSNFATRRTGSVLRVRMFSRRVRVQPDADVETVVVELPPTHHAPDQERIVVYRDGQTAEADFDVRSSSGPIPVLGGTGPLEIRLVRTDAVRPEDVRRGRPQVFSYVRRGLAESLERASALR
ncbi:MAG TPA: hypothetical protein VJT84_12160 [Gaiellaceae bacterium]|nr:hypothetical protein [Gaiellaceae bacterium]